MEIQEEYISVCLKKSFSQETVIVKDRKDSHDKAEQELSLFKLRSNGVSDADIAASEKHFRNARSAQNLPEKLLKQKIRKKCKGELDSAVKAENKCGLSLKQIDFRKVCQRIAVKTEDIKLLEHEYVTFLISS